MSTLLIVDDDAETVRFMEELLAAPGRRIVTALAPDRAMALVREHAPDVVISDIHLNAERTGVDLLRAIRSGGHAARVVLISGFGTLETAIDAVRHGAFDYISKPFDIAEVKGVVERALRSPEAPTDAPAPQDAPPGLIGRSSAMLAVYKQIAQAADAQAPVLIVGESGTGKELVARAIHRHGRHDLPGRDQRDLGGAAGQAASRPSRRRGEAGRRDAADQGRRPCRCRHQR